MLKVLSLLLRPIGTAFLVLSSLLVSADCVNAQQFKAAAGKVDITPVQPAFIAGYGNNRKSVDAHDRLFARCIVIERGSQRIALVSCDLIGVPRFEILNIRSMVNSVAAENVIIGATHTHSGPDTLGMWGPALTVSGVDKKWLIHTEKQIAELVDQTALNLEPAIARFASTSDVRGISKNIRVPAILDTQLAVVQFVTAVNPRTIATIVNYACHPEILNNHHITADFPHWLYETVETALGGTCVYFNGAQGGMVTAAYDVSTAPRGENWAAAEAIGKMLGTRTLEVLHDATAITDPELTIAKRKFHIPLENARYRTLIKMKVFSGAPDPDGTLETEVCRIGIGPAEFLTIPGEALPNVGFYIKRLMHGNPKFLLGLTNDFLGYILAPEDFGLELYSYESGQSAGSSLEPLMIQNDKLLLERSATETKPVH